MSIKTKLIVLFAVPITALLVTAILGFRSQSVDAEVIEDAVASATVSSAINDLALAAGAERLPAGSLPDIEVADLQAQTDGALDGLRSAERFAGITVGAADLADQIAAARSGSADGWNLVLDELLQARDALPIDDFDSTGTTATLATRSASWGLVMQEAAWLAALEVTDGQVASGIIADFAVAETVLSSATAQTFGTTDPFGGASTSEAQLRLNELRALASEDLTRGTTGEFDRAEIIATLGSTRLAWSGAIVEADAVVLDGLVDRNDAIVDARSLFLLLAAVAGVLLAALLFVTGRSILRPLDVLIDEADRVANVRLPKVVSHLRSLGASDEIPPLPEIPKHSDDEVGALVDAFNEVQGTAVLLATEQAQSRRNYAEMFVNFGRRNQQLNHRMLALLSELEQNEQDPEVLADLYQLDAMATRMRRNAESLLVLAGNQTPRQWSKPISLERTVRSALAEVEAHDRVDVTELPDVSLPGAVVADITHLLAELIENATNFSDPSTTVHVHAYRMREGLMIQITDDGIGIGAADLTVHNERLSMPPRLDEAPSRLLGLFVVGRLADRHDIHVVLESDSGAGTIAHVAVPTELIVEAEDPVVDVPIEPVAPVAATDPVVPAAETWPAAVDTPAFSSTVIPPAVPVAPDLPVTVDPEIMTPAPPPVPAAPGAPTPGAASGLPTRAPQQAFAETMPPIPAMSITPPIPPAVPEPTPIPVAESLDSIPTDGGAGEGFSSLVAFMGGVNRGLAEADGNDWSER